VVVFDYDRCEITSVVGNPLPNATSFEVCDNGDYVIKAGYRHVPPGGGGFYKPTAPSPDPCGEPNPVDYYDVKGTLLPNAFGNPAMPDGRDQGAFTEFQMFDWPDADGHTRNDFLPHHRWNSGDRYEEADRLTFSHLWFESMRPLPPAPARVRQVVAAACSLSGTNREHEHPNDCTNCYLEKNAKGGIALEHVIWVFTRMLACLNDSLGSKRCPGYSPEVVGNEEILAHEFGHGWLPDHSEKCAYDFCDNCENHVERYCLMGGLKLLECTPLPQDTNIDGFTEFGVMQDKQSPGPPYLECSEDFKIIRQTP
jgi:hypothetical protein